MRLGNEVLLYISEKIGVVKPISGYDPRENEDPDLEAKIADPSPNTYTFVVKTLKYYMSKKQLPILYSDLLYEIGYYFLDRQYIYTGRLKDISSF